MQTKQFKKAKFVLLWSCKDGFSSFLVLQEKKQFNLFKPISYSTVTARTYSSTITLRHNFSKLS